MLELDLSLRLAMPYQSVGLIKSFWPNGQISIGTCSLVGRNDVLTAGHIVYDPDLGGYANNFEFYFGADYNSKLSVFEGDSKKIDYNEFIVNCWPKQIFSKGSNLTMSQDESQYDIALIGLDNPIGDTLGHLNMYPTSRIFLVADSVGYPEDSTGMILDSVIVQNSYYWGVYETQQTTLGAGSSGGPLLINNQIIGVKSIKTIF